MPTGRLMYEYEFVRGVPTRRSLNDKFGDFELAITELGLYKVGNTKDETVSLRVSAPRHSGMPCMMDGLASDSHQTHSDVSMCLKQADNSATEG